MRAFPGLSKLSIFNLSKPREEQILQTREQILQLLESFLARVFGKKVEITRVDQTNQTLYRADPPLSARCFFRSRYLVPHFPKFALVYTT